MDGDKARQPVAQVYEPPARCADGDRAAGQGSGCGRAERDGQGWLDDLELLVQPPFAGFDLAGIGLLVQPLLAARLELEVLHGVGDVDTGSVDSGLGQGAIENL